VWLKETKQEAKHVPDACRSKAYNVYYDYVFKVTFWILMLGLEFIILGLHYLRLMQFRIDYEEKISIKI
jgi:hypothetical protein